MKIISIALMCSAISVQAARQGPEKGSLKKQPSAAHKKILTIKSNDGTSFQLLADVARTFVPILRDGAIVSWANGQILGTFVELMNRMDMPLPHDKDKRHKQVIDRANLLATFVNIPDTSLHEYLSAATQFGKPGLLSEPFAYRYAQYLHANPDIMKQIITKESPRNRIAIGQYHLLLYQTPIDTELELKQPSHVSSHMKHMFDPERDARRHRLK